MLDSWNEMIFTSIKDRLQSIAMDLVYRERNGDIVDSQLVIGVRQSYGQYINPMVPRYVLVLKRGYGVYVSSYIYHMVSWYENSLRYKFSFLTTIFTFILITLRPKTKDIKTYLQLIYTEKKIKD